jgi:perosamine synthetase
MIIPLSRPDITNKEIQRVIEVLHTPHLSFGPCLTEFEQKFAEYIGTQYAIAVSSGTAGLHVALISLNIGKDDAVITTPLSFIASANCILLAGATPLFIDIEAHTYNVDPEKIRHYIEHHCSRNEMTGTILDRKTGKCVRAILPVHIFGQPCDMEKIVQLADEYNLLIIEDACEAIGAEYNGKKVGTFGNASIFAFYPNKQITTGEGGMIVTNDARIAFLCRSLRNQGRDDDGGWLAHSRLGYNYRLSDINCALGIAQLERIDEILNKRAIVAARYNELLKDSMHIPETIGGVKRSWFVYVICLNEKYSRKDRDDILIKLSAKGIGCSNYFPPIHLQPFYRKMFGYKEGDFEITEYISDRTIALPFHTNMKQEEIGYVVENLLLNLQSF